MPTILAHGPVRELPIYQAGVAAGVDIGPRLALDALTAELGRQEQLAALRPESTTITYVYAPGCLLDLTRVVAARFRVG